MSGTLGSLLSYLRRQKGSTLREVEIATGVSNSYISQLECGGVKDVSPRKLDALATYYEYSYGILMRAAGYRYGDLKEVCECNFKKDKIKEAIKHIEEFL